MTGAAACLAGFDGITVIIHGSSGCYYYPTTLLHAPLHGTFILENEVIFGSEARLHEVIGEVQGTGKRIAVVTTCVPAILGEDIRSMLSSHDVILVDSPGFSGDFGKGYHAALSVLAPETDPSVAGINIDGVSLFDPFYRGNMREVIRLLARAGVPVGLILCRDRFDRVRHAAPFTIGTDGDLASGVGTFLGSTLGFEALSETFSRVGDALECADIEPVLADIRHDEERVVQACDKYLRRFDPPSVAIFSSFSYAAFAARTLDRYLDADIVCIGSRTGIKEDLPYPVKTATGLSDVQRLIGNCTPDLVIGSSFERSVKGEATFIGITPPLRGSVRLASHPLAGTEGVLFLIEAVLNACMDRQQSPS
jgi:nitrogenase molybdenum-iron protein alpha/beta subunit